MIGMHKSQKSLLDRVRPKQHEPHEKKLLQKIEKSQIGYDSTLQGPFGIRRGKQIVVCTIFASLQSKSQCTNGRVSD